jgi:hypothetical protein
MEGAVMSMLKHLCLGLVSCLTAGAVTMLAVGPSLAARPKPPKNQKAPKMDVPGSLTIMSLTHGAIVELDGKEVGKVPLEDALVVLAGEHTVKVHKRGFANHEETFTVAPGEAVDLEIDLLAWAGILQITTAEPGAAVKVDGKVLGVTPFDQDVPAGKKVVTVSRPDFYDEVRDLEIHAGEYYQFDIALKPLPKEVAGDSQAFYETWWFWTIVGVAGAGTAAAIVATSSGDTVSPTPAFSLNIP